MDQFDFITMDHLAATISGSDTSGTKSGLQQPAVLLVCPVPRSEGP